MNFRDIKVLECSLKFVISRDVPRQSWTRWQFPKSTYKGIMRVRYTLQDFSRGCKNDDLKNVIDFPSEVLSHSAIKQKIYTSDAGGKKKSEQYLLKWECSKKDYSAKPNRSWPTYNYMTTNLTSWMLSTPILIKEILNGEEALPLHQFLILLYCFCEPPRNCQDA